MMKKKGEKTMAKASPARATLSKANTSDQKAEEEETSGNIIVTRRSEVQSLLEMCLNILKRVVVNCDSLVGVPEELQRTVFNYRYHFFISKSIEYYF